MPLLTTTSGAGLAPYGFGLLGGGAGGGGPAMELISTAYGTGSSGVISFSSIPQTYKHLQIRFASRDNGNTTRVQPLQIKYNSTTGYYYNHYFTGNGGATYTDYFAQSGQVYLAYQPVGTSDTYRYAAGIVDLLDYSDTNTNPVLKCFTGFYRGASDNANPQLYDQVRLSSAKYESAIAITSITLYNGWGYFDTGTRFSLYGIKG